MKIGIIDFTSYYTDDVIRTVKRTGVDHELFDHNADIDKLRECDGLIFTGSHDTVYQGGKRPDPRIFELRKPILGICYGHQVIHYMFGGEVSEAAHPEHGRVYLDYDPQAVLFRGLPESYHPVMHHNDEVTRMAQGFVKTASTDDCLYAGTQDIERKIYTVQFHPEADEDEHGSLIYENFIRTVREDLHEEND